MTLKSLTPKSLAPKSLALAAGLGLAALALAVPADAHGPRHHHHGYYGHYGPRSSVHIDIGGWRRGYWHHGYYGPRFGWWWVVPSGYYYYPEPVYPYPDYDRPSTVVIEREAPAPAVTGAPPPQYWYYCDDPEGYYPYVSECRENWRPVPVTPPGKGE